MADLFADITTVRKALAAAAANVPGLTGLHYLPGVVNPPLFATGPATIDMDSSGPATATGLAVECRLYAAAASAERAGYELMDSYMSPKGANSVVAALLADLSLGGVCLTLRCERWVGPGIATIGVVQYIAATLAVVVF